MSGESGDATDIHDPTGASVDHLWRERLDETDGCLQVCVQNILQIGFGFGFSVGLGLGLGKYPPSAQR